MQEMPEAVASDGAERKFKAVYTICDRGEKKPVWLRIGTAFVNRDQSLTVRLDALPQNGTLHIRDWVPYEERNGRRDDPYPRRADDGAYRSTGMVG